MKLIGVDVGGTFTDLIITDSETRESAIHKVPTTPDDPSDGAAAGIAQLCERSGTAPGASPTSSTAPRSRPTRCSSTTAPRPG